MKSEKDEIFAEPDFADEEDELALKLDALKKELVEKAKKTGTISQEEVLDRTKNLDLSDSQYDELFSFFSDQGLKLEKSEDDDDEFVDDEDIDESEMLEAERLVEEDEFESDDEEEEEEENLDDLVVLQAGEVKVNDSVKMYLKEIGKSKLLSAQEETDLAKQIAEGEEAKPLLEQAIKEGDEAKIRDYTYLVDQGAEAKNTLVERNLRLVVNISKHYQNKGMPILDLIQEGNLGLIKAAEKFDYTKGFKFSTYATWWIRQAITRAIADQARTIRIPVHLVETINKMSRIQRNLTQELNREPTPEEISAALDEKDRAKLTPDRIREIQRIALDPVSLETPIGEEDDSKLGDFVEDKNAQSPSEFTSRSMLKDELSEIMKDLTDREEKVLRLRYGLDDNRPRTLEEVGKEFGVTRERIRQIEAKAIRKLRHPNRAKKLGDYRDISSPGSMGPEINKKK